MDTCIIDFKYNLEFMHMRVCVCVFANVTNVYAHVWRHWYVHICISCKRIKRFHRHPHAHQLIYCV